LGAAADAAPVQSRRNAGRRSDWRQRCLEGIRRLDLPYVARVGGDVRDELRGRTDSKDLDAVVCGISYDDLEATCRRAGKVEPLESNGQLVGVRLWAAWTPREGVEIALARTEVSTGDGHRDFEIRPIPAEKFASLTASGMTAAEAGRQLLLQDLERRDFTVNAIAADVITGELLDPYGGAQDIRTRTLRMVASTAFRDDPLRILRGLARASRDGLTPDDITREQMTVWADNIRHLSAERISEELMKMLDGDHIVDALRLGRDTRTLEVFLPELASTFALDQRSRYHALTTDEHIFQVVRHAVQRRLPLEVKLAALLHDCGKPEAAFEGADGRLHFYNNKRNPQQRAHEIVGAEKGERALKRMRKIPVPVQRRAVYLIRHHMFRDAHEFADISPRRQQIKARRFLAEHGHETAQQLIALRWCDWAGKSEDGTISDENRRHLETFAAEVSRQYARSQRVTAAGVPEVALDRRHLAVNGADMRDLGFQHQEISQVLNEMLHGARGDFPGVVTDPDLNDRDRLLAWASRRFRAVQARRPSQH
jgi:tRNA nucleotidyltransferase (CCA-adding enzyme)